MKTPTQFGTTWRLPSYKAADCFCHDKGQCGWEGTQEQPCWGSVDFDEVFTDDGCYWEHFCEGHGSVRDFNPYKPSNRPEDQ